MSFRKRAQPHQRPHLRLGCWRRGRAGGDRSGRPAYAKAKVRRGEGETLHDFAMKLAHVPLRYQPGERWMYSLATDVCGYLVEAISGKRFDKYLQETIFDPPED